VRNDRAAVQTTPEGDPVLACFAQQPFTIEEVAIFVARLLATSATVVSDGLWCFREGKKHTPLGPSPATTSAGSDPAHDP
jgi:hypothetical protein